jgi:hypothetical protein
MQYPPLPDAAAAISVTVIFSVYPSTLAVPLAIVLGFIPILVLIGIREYYQLACGSFA